MRKLIIGALAAAAVVAAIAPAAWSSSQQLHIAKSHWFHAHVNANSNHHNCYYLTEWTSPGATCHAIGETSNHPGPFWGSGITVGWCGAHDPVCAENLTRHPVSLPHGYDRWMTLCAHAGNEHCHHWLLGAVKMPNGPFAVVDGRIHGHKVTPTSTDQHKVEHQGGPLFLYVGYAGWRGHYVFGFRGWLHY